MQKIKIEESNTLINVLPNKKYYFTKILTGKDNVMLFPVFKITSENVNSEIDIRVVLKDSSKFTFKGKLKIENKSKQTDANMNIKCLMIGEKCFAEIEPNLEISENEVSASHGASIGQIDKSEMHFLKSRGMSEIESQELIIDAFIRF